MDDLIEFGLNIKRLRQMRHLSQEQLAGECELDRTYISGIERGQRNIGLRNIFKIARALDVTPEQLFIGGDNVI